MNNNLEHIHTNPKDHFDAALKKANCKASLTTGLVYSGVLYLQLKEENSEKAIYYLRQAIDAGDENCAAIIDTCLFIRGDKWVLLLH